MVFRRREQPPLWRRTAAAVWPRGGWGRAFEYVRHRLRRLPDSPEKIGRGLAAGVFTAFTPFYFVHFVVAVLVARLVRGNLLAALVGTFANNPLTIVPIGAVAMTTGRLILSHDRPGHGPGPGPEHGPGLGRLFAEAAGDLWGNLLAVATPARAHWDGLALFWDRVFLPYLVGGIVPGLVAGLLAYAVAVPVARVWQAGRRKALAERLQRLQAAPGATPPDAAGGPR